MFNRYKSLFALLVFVETHVEHEKVSAQEKKNHERLYRLLLIRSKIKRHVGFKEWF